MSINKESTSNDTNVNNKEILVDKTSSTQSSLSMNKSDNLPTERASRNNNQLSIKTREQIIKEQYQLSRARKLVMAYSKPTMCSNCYIFKKRTIKPYPKDLSEYTVYHHDHMDVTLISVLSYILLRYM